jgi:hypothetical protein
MMMACSNMVQAQDDLTVNMMYDLSLEFYNPDSFLQGVLRDNDTAYVFTQLAPELFVFNVSSVTANLEQGDLDFKLHVYVDAQPTVQVNTGFLDSLLKTVYIGGANSIYKVNMSGIVESLDLPDSSFTTQTSFVDVPSRKGYFVSTSISPGRILVIDLDQFNVSKIIEIPIRSENVYTSVYDSDTKIAYLASYDGNLEVVDLANQVSTIFSNTSGVDYHYQVIVMDTTHGYLYTCGNNNSVSTISIYNTSLEFIANVNIPDLSDDCTAGTLDLQRGQGFFSFYDSSTALVLSVNLPNRLTPTYAPVLADNPQMVGAYLSPANLSLFLVSNSQLVLLTYTSSCTDDCSNHGDCQYGTCICDLGWYGDACADVRCDTDCNDNGACSLGLCYCNANYTGYNCSIRQCPSACSTHGVCSGAPDWTCVCTDSWSGIDCATAPPPAPPPQCATLSGYKSCVSHKYCGWCGDILHGDCREGNIEGPVYGSCIAWNYHQNPELGVIILAVVFLVLIGLMFITDAVSAIMVDYRRAKDLEREYTSGVIRKPSVAEAASLWWRDQRSAKAWTFLEQFQFFTLFTHLAMSYPTRIQSFTRFIQWTNLGIPLAFLKDHSVHENRRTLLGLVQYGNGLDMLPKNLYAANMFWFAIGLAIITVVFGVLALITYTKSHWRTVFLCRLVYLIMRFMSMAYMGIMMTCAYTLVASPHNYRTIVPAAFTLVIIGLGYPLTIYLILDGRNKQLFENEFKYKFGCLYVNYRPEHCTYHLVQLSRKAITGLFVGFLAFSAQNHPKWVVWFQIIMLGIAQLAYAYKLFRTKPYYDQYHEYLDYFLVIVNCGTIALSMLHYNKPSEAGELIVGLIQVLGYIGCIGCYIISWMQMNTLSLSKLFCCFKSRREPMEGNVPLDTVSHPDTFQ